MSARQALITSLSAIAVSTVITGCGVGQANVPETQPEPMPIPVSVATAQIGTIAARYSATAALEADAEAPVVARTGGEVIEILVEEGDFVKSGQVLVRLDGERQRLATEQARANHRKVQQQYQRNVELHKQGLVSGGTFEDMKYEVDALEAAFELARLYLSYTEIRAPISGVVSERLVKLGNSVSESQIVFRVADPESLVAHLHVPQRQLYKFQLGQPATLTADALPGDHFDALIERISPTVDAEKGTFKITLTVADDQNALMPGMFTRIGVTYDTHTDALTVPANAVLDEDTAKSIFVIQDSIARRVNITTGIATDDRIEVLSGLDENAKIVIVGQNGIKDGSRVVEEEAAI